ncbi:uncharacterized protein LOC135974940 isoform X3 [Chrysemys picta bellii]|uniref:uncharacterized protein LOC135974940 isoform X3 n=1 Tax=Chrysemys picta bellii TaxID=8478 RepID=UPI0032B2419B
MELELVRRMLTYLISTLRLAVELFLKIQSDSESEESDDAIEPRNAYDTKLLVSATNMLSTVEHRFWARETSTEWWDHIVMDVWDDEQWLQNFRMRKATFMGLCEDLAPTLRRKDTRLRAALPVEKQVAIAIRKLATPDCYRSVANQFGVGKSTVGIVLMQVCKAINRILLRRTVTLGVRPGRYLPAEGDLGSKGGSSTAMHLLPWPICSLPVCSNGPPAPCGTVARTR